MCKPRPDSAPSANTKRRLGYLNSQATHNRKIPELLPPSYFFFNPLKPCRNRPDI